MKIFVLLLLSLISFNGSTQNTNETDLYETFQKILKTDRSNVRKPEVRNHIFVNNLSNINGLLKEGVSLNTEIEIEEKLRKTMSLGLLVTFLHTLQSDPTLLLNDSTVVLYSDCIHKNTLALTELKYALKFFQKDLENGRFMKWKSYFEERLPIVLEKWKLMSLSPD